MTLFLEGKSFFNYPKLDDWYSALFSRNRKKAEYQVPGTTNNQIISMGKYGKMMNIIKNVLCLIGLLNALFLYGAELDELSKFKNNLVSRFGPQKEWKNLVMDKSFTLKYEAENSYIKYPSCINATEDMIFVVDNNGDKVNIYSHSGGFLKTFGRLGRGPGDMASPYWLETFENKIYVRSNNGIDRFNQNQKFEYRIRVFCGIRHFSIIDDHIYGAIRKPFRDKCPLFIKMDMEGRITDLIMDEDVDVPFFRKTKADIFVLYAHERFVVVPQHWNKIYIYDKNLKLIKKQKHNYQLLDMIEQWNDRSVNKKKNTSFFWPCNLVKSARVLDGKIYIFLNLPSRLEILALNRDGTIEAHLYNTSFPLMRWLGFDVLKMNDRITFYALAHSLSDDEDEDLAEFNIYRFFLDSPSCSAEQKSE